MLERTISIAGAFGIIFIAIIYLLVAFIYELYEALIDDDRNF